MRLVTRADLDGLACAVLITSFELIDDLLLIHPQEITDRKVEITGDDILANVPYHPACAKWFDHHLLTKTNREPPKDFDGRFGYAPSAAELVWEYYGKDPRFEEMVTETNRLDSARLHEDDVLDPQGYIQLGFTLDSRSGLGEFKQYFENCIHWVKSMPIEAVLEQPDVKMRVEMMREQDREFRMILEAQSEVDKNVVITDFRPLDIQPVGNRFLIFVLHPEANVSLRVQWGPEKEFVVAAVGHSIFNRTCRTNVGVLLSRYGGGGHVGAGSTPLEVDKAEEQLAEILAELRE